MDKVGRDANPTEPELEQDPDEVESVQIGRAFDVDGVAGCVCPAGLPAHGQLAGRAARRGGQDDRMTDDDAELFELGQELKLDVVEFTATATGQLQFLEVRGGCHGPSIRGDFWGDF